MSLPETQNFQENPNPESAVGDAGFYCMGSYDGLSPPFFFLSSRIKGGVHLSKLNNTAVTSKSTPQ